MNKTQYRENDCNVAIKIEKVPSVKSFFSVAKGGKAKAPIETGPKDFLDVGWKDEAEKQMAQSKRKAASLLSGPLSPATKKIKPSASFPSPARGSSKKLLHKQSPTKPGQITSFFAAAKPKTESSK